MTKQIVSEMSWKESDLEELQIEDGFRMRGLETTRLDTLVDAGFAFVLSFLAISQDSLPTSFAELAAGIKSVPALILSFLMLMVFWLEHRRWSRRYGIETRLSIFLSVSLLFVLLIYIFPLRMIFESMFEFLTGGFLPFEFKLESYMDARHFFGIYSVGFLVMTLIIALLYGVAIKKKSALLLSKAEYQDTYNIYCRWLIAGFFALISIILAYTLPPNQIHWSGFVYFGLFITQFLYIKLFSKK